MSVDIVIAVFNQLHYTKTCLETLRASVPPEVNVIVIDNGSTDGTADYLVTQPWVKVIANGENRGCAAAWNQGVNAGSSSWVVVMNNDVILPAGWLEGLMGYAAETGTDVVSPALREGEYNYDIEPYARQFMTAMAKVARRGEAHGVCFMVRREIFNTIGLFDENFKIGGSEDTDFFWRARHAGFSLATTGRSFMHHFGCITQDYIKAEVLGRCYGPEHRAHFRRKWKLNWWKRFLIRRKGKFIDFWRRNSERIRSGRSLREKWFSSRNCYR